MKSQLPKPSEVAACHETHKNDLADAIVDRLTQQMRCNGPVVEHRVDVLVSEGDDAVVELVVDHARSLGWDASVEGGDDHKTIVLRPGR